MRKIAENRCITNHDFNYEQLRFIEKNAVHRKNGVIWEDHQINKAMVSLVI